MVTTHQRWLVKGDRVLASLDIATDRRSRRRGLLGRDGLDGALLLPNTRSVHTIGMRFPIDVAFCDADLKVLRVLTLQPWRITLPRPHERCVIETERGSFEKWDVEVGDRLETR
jgi:uncharacterized membrane protein (UPF0127 family)